MFIQVAIFRSSIKSLCLIILLVTFKLACKLTNSTKHMSHCPKAPALPSRGSLHSKCRSQGHSRRSRENLWFKVNPKDNRACNVRTGITYSVQTTKSNHLQCLQAGQISPVSMTLIYGSQSSLKTSIKQCQTGLHSSQITQLCQRTLSHGEILTLVSRTTTLMIRHRLLRPYQCQRSTRRTCAS